MQVPPYARSGGRVRLAGTALFCLAIASQSLAAGERSGEAIYKERCVACHGANGEGSKEYKQPLAGDRSVKQLARLIAKTMPEDDPGTCTGEDADKVAAYIYDAFYSRTARARNQPARVELSRLTVRQYRNAVADLVGSFRWNGRWDDHHGLHGVYSKGRNPWGNRKGLERDDAEVKFDFGVGSPDPEKLDADVFSIRWEGSVLAPETGEYEFIVRTENATRLWVNDNKNPLIDAWVKSGNDTVYRGSIFLLGGRVYPLRLEFSKAKQGVDDSKKGKKAPEVKASVALEWTPPHRASEVIPSRCLTPDKFPEAFAPATPFPPDDSSVGYERGTSVSKAWDQAATDAAIEVAAYVAAHLGELAGTRDDAPDRKAKVREFCLRFVERAFRRPLTDEQKRRYVDHWLDGTGDLELAVRRVVLLTLKSPRFLYLGIGDPKDPFEVASRLSFGLWDSLPDQQLREAAAGGKLADREQVAAQANRMAGDLRTRAKLREFFLQWLKIEQVPDLAKDAGKYPGFDAAIASDLRTSLELTLDDIVWSDASDFRRLLLAEDVFLNGRLAKFYGADLPADAPFQKVQLEPRERAGLLTHPYMMARFAYTATSSPIHRGVFIARSVLGRGLRPPPQAVSPLPPDLHAGLSNRERVTLQTSPAACQTCHSMINPLGFSLEHFDAVGRYRGDEKGRTIDATGSYEPPSGSLAKFDGARGLAELLAGSEETHAAFVEQLFHYLVKQPIRAYGDHESADLRRDFARDGFNIRKLTVAIVESSALTAPPATP